MGMCVDEWVSLCVITFNKKSANNSKKKQQLPKHIAMWSSAFFLLSVFFPEDAFANLVAAKDALQFGDFLDFFFKFANLVFDQM